MHAVGFELRLLVIFTILFAWWFEITYTKAFLMDIAVTGFFLIGTFLYTWTFDLLFGQPKLKSTS